MQQKDNSKQDDRREAGLMVSAAMQGYGKTRQNMLLVSRYVRDKIATKVRGRKVLILDPNGEYTAEEIAKAGIKGLEIKKIKVGDVKDWVNSDLIEARRIDMKSLIPDEMLKILKYIVLVVKDLLLVIEDMNAIILDITKEKAIVQRIIKLRHIGVDVLTSYQSLRAVEPRMLQNSRFLRLHYQLGDIDDISGKLPCDREVFKVAQIIVNTKAFNGNEYFFLYVYTGKGKLKGEFTTEDFMTACQVFLLDEGKRIKAQMRITKCSEEAAIAHHSKILYKQFYGNDDKLDYSQKLLN